MISLRTTEALAKCKAEGQKLGQPKGQKAVHLKLDEKEAEIRGYLAQGISKRAIANLVECSPSTLYQWMERRHVHPQKKSRV